MISSTTILPDDYRKTGEVDLSKGKGLIVLVNILGFVLLVLSLIVLGWFLGWARPDLSATSQTFAITFSGILGFFLALSLMVLVHELIHGLFFWVFTRSRPVFALHLRYAYAAAPEWFIPVSQYWIIALAPLLFIGGIGLVSLLLVPVGWIPALGFLVALNTAGSIGDLWVFARLLRLAPDSLANDRGDRVSFFEPVMSKDMG